MPVSKYYKGHGEEVMRSMVSEYGPKKGKQVFYATANKRSKKVRRITEDDPRWNPRTMGNHRGSKNTKTAPGANGQYRPT